MLELKAKQLKGLVHPKYIKHIKKYFLVKTKAHFVCFLYKNEMRRSKSLMFVH